jgi:hypothetical protein
MAVTEPDFLRDTRASYDAVAADYAERYRDELIAKPLADLLERAGLNVRARLLREPDEEGDFPERTQQGFVLARKPAGA